LISYIKIFKWKAMLITMLVNPFIGKKECFYGFLDRDGTIYLGSQDSQRYNRNLNRVILVKGKQSKLERAIGIAIISKEGKGRLISKRFNPFRALFREVYTVYHYCPELIEKE